jgi:L-amino acid N-acyltransferase YncA
MDFTIGVMTADDWPQVAAIFQEGIDTGHSTFETDVPTWEKWNADHLEPCRLIARNGEALLGWAALTKVSGRCVYGGVAEVSVYVAAAARGQGVGKALLLALIEASERAGFWTLEGKLMVENTASRALVRASGFREVGIRERLGQLHGVWHDIVLVERRSKVVGGS